MSSKKLIMMIIVASVLLVLFMGYAFKKIQTVDIKLTYLDSPLKDQSLLEVRDTLNEYKDVTFVSDSTIGSINVLLVNHRSQTSVLWHEGHTQVVDYMKLDPSIINGNHYMAYNSNEPTLILNCDPILGDPFERAVVITYQHRLSSLTDLNPSEIDYFEHTDENVIHRYERFQMIESLKSAYLHSNDLETFGYYYIKWKEDVGEDYQLIIDYDYYDGLAAFLTYKVRQLVEPDYRVELFLDDMINPYEVYNKSTEYEVMGLLWFLIAEEKGLNLFQKDDVRTDHYKLLLDGTPYTSIEEGTSYNDYAEKYQAYQKGLKSLVDTAVLQSENDDLISLNLISESYGDTIKVADTKYIHLDYKGRYKDDSLLEKEVLMVEVTPYSIKYFMNNN